MSIIFVEYRVGQNSGPLSKACTQNADTNLSGVSLMYILQFTTVITPILTDFIIIVIS